jgi:hypothetical protein
MLSNRENSQVERGDVCVCYVSKNDGVTRGEEELAVPKFVHNILRNTLAILLIANWAAIV